MSQVKTENPLMKAKYRSYCHLLSICANICLSAFFVGYSLVYLGALNKSQFKTIIMKGYGLYIGSSKDPYVTTQAILQGLAPMGAIIGALLSSPLIKFFSRRNGFLVTNIFAFTSLVIIAYIKNPVSFIIGRLLQGACVGIFSAIVPLYINQIVTPDSGNLGSLNQLFIAGAQGLCFLWYFFLSKVINRNQFLWKMLCELPLVTILIQTIILLFVFPYETPKYFYDKGKRNEAASLIAIVYKEQYVDQAISRFESGASSLVSQDEASVAVKTELIGDPNRKFVTSRIAIFFAIHLALLQQLSGVNAIVIYGNKTLGQVISNQDAVNLLASLNTFIPAFMAFVTIKVMKWKGRKFLIQLGTLVCAICLAVMTLAFILKGNDVEVGGSDKLPAIMTIAAMFVFMTFFGLTLGPIVWLYIPEIVEPNIIPFSTMTNLAGATLCIMAFPFLSDINPAWFFGSFCIWCVLSLLVNARIMVQTKDKSRIRVFEQFSTKKLF